MYLLLLFVLLAAGGMLVRAGYSKHRPAVVWAGALLVVTTVILFSVLSFWGEALWFHAVGYGSRFWTFLGAQTATLLAGALIALLAVFLLNTPARRLRRVVSPWTELIGAAGGAFWGLGAWQPALLYFNRTQAGITEPILGLDAGFYLFILPFLEALRSLFFWILAVAAGGAMGAILFHVQESRLRSNETRRQILWPVATVSTALGLAIGASAVLAVFHLLYSEFGVTAGRAGPT